MAIILLFTILGFLVGFFYVIVKRKIRPANLLTSAFLGIISLLTYRFLKDFFKKRRGRWGY